MTSQKWGPHPVGLTYCLKWKRHQGFTDRCLKRLQKFLSCHVRIQREGSHLQAGKGALTRKEMVSYLELGFPSLQNCKKEIVLVSANQSGSLSQRLKQTDKVFYSFQISNNVYKVSLHAVIISVMCLYTCCVWF